ncbi:hypothetical protein HJC23_004926 [Cyclotella cryptica]|uniref:Aminotransferase class IV n=1 Tax=Cyclotella cryptica TaxID=29204 RepID=A0ABD3PS70_9STRA|eukprot:CCRYP_011890-RA/>CCRYP_011890-RA protein AED:0.42 eAED:0.42 QI:0/-1/0/1/-1/1/1/0/499
MTSKTLGHCESRSASNAEVAADAVTGNLSETNEKNNRYIVSRNGVILTWEEIYQRYPLIDSENGTSIGSESAQHPAMDSSALLQRLPRGAYTTCRTVKGGTHIYQFDYHVRRLAVSSASILECIYGSTHVIDDNDGLCSTVAEDSAVKDGFQVAASAKANDNSTMKSIPKDELSESNHPRQHNRNPSKIEIQNMNIIQEAWERQMALTCVRSTLDSFRSLYLTDTGEDASINARDKAILATHENVSMTKPDAEFRITLLATWEDSQNLKSDVNNKASINGFQSALYCHIGLLTGNSSSKHVRVLVHGHGRENAMAKDSKWVTDRKQLTLPHATTSAKSEMTLGSPSPTSLSYEEIILINDNGELLEGTQTNFYVVKNSTTIITANEGVLFGSVRDSVLRVCQSHGIDVELRPPTLHDLKVASGVFITSTSRWVMPVHQIDLGDLLLMDEFIDGKRNKSDGTTAGCNEVSSFCYHNCPTTNKIRQWVLENVETHSTPIYA